MRRTRRALAAWALVTCCTGGLASAAAAQSTDGTATAAIPEGSPAPAGYQPVFTPGSGPDGVGASSTAKVKPPKITWHGGEVMTAPAGVNIYLIWYGTWSDAAAKSIVTTFITDLNKSKYYGINTGYTGGPKKKIVNKVNLAGQTTDAGSQGTSNLSDTAIRTIVTSAISSNQLPKDANGVYFVLTSADVTKTGFMSSFCGWHTYTTALTTPIKYSFVGNADKNSACTPQTLKSPNDTPAVDAMLSVIAHELAEPVTDPYLNAWYDEKGDENADKCAWTFGKELTAANGSRYNVVLNGHQYLLQQNWKKAGPCALK
jgi:hypothetical protein